MLLSKSFRKERILDLDFLMTCFRECVMRVGFVFPDISDLIDFWMLLQDFCYDAVRSQH